MYVEEKKVIRKGHHGFTKGKSHLTNMIIFEGAKTGCVDEGRAADIVCLDSNKLFDAVCHGMFRVRLRKF